ncbi:hypothetical protein [Sphingobium xenophagum]|uniref:Uncharacterized protein n=1 Tax=Sphingobium xenophagum TaxID=121428 RepID=A0A401J1W3_SPHXE|nr:hypothetical protein [Sphingobium xenophagum]GBH30618.1 hypothetical protein MBESOW_P1873 [Sphingobium xenophagum]
MPAFFVPKCDAEKQDEQYVEWAQKVHGGVAAPDRRIYSITWRADGVEWTATVGEELRGVETITKGRGRMKREMTVPRHTNDTVLAIYEGDPFIIVHDSASRTWNWPIYAGRPSSVVRFS